MTALWHQLSIHDPHVRLLEQSDQDISTSSRAREILLLFFSATMKKKRRTRTLTSFANHDTMLSNLLPRDDLIRASKQQAAPKVLMLSTDSTTGKVVRTPLPQDDWHTTPMNNTQEILGRCSMGTKTYITFCRAEVESTPRTPVSHDARTEIQAGSRSTCLSIADTTQQHLNRTRYRLADYQEPERGKRLPIWTCAQRRRYSSVSHERRHAPLRGTISSGMHHSMLLPKRYLRL